MKRGKIVLGIVVLVGIVALLGSAQFGYGKEKPGAVPGKVVPLTKCAGWKIKSLKADKKCYELPATCDKEFIFLITAELEASPGSSPAGGLVIDAVYKTCTYESGKMPPLDLTTAPTGTWIPWGGAKVRITKLSSHRIKLDFSEYHVSCKCDGTSPVTIILTVHSMCGGRAIGKDTKTLTLRPCPCPKVATWKIVKIDAQPACYTPPPPCTHTPRDRDFIHKMTAVLEAGPASLPPGGIVLDGSAWDCALAAAKALSPLDLTSVPVGGSVTLTWGATTVVAKRPDSHHIHLYLPECHIGCGCAGGPTITSTITAHTMNCGREVGKHTRVHNYLPCP